MPEELPIMNVESHIIENHDQTPSISVPIYIYSKILDYLMNKPYKEVAPLIKDIESSMSISKKGV